MVKRFGFAVSFCLLLFLNVSFAQSEKSGSKKGIKEFAVADVSCESSRTCNSFLKVISQSSGFPIDKARYSIYYTFNYKIQNREAIIEVVLDSIRGTTVYRGFDLSNKLIPSSVELAWAYFLPDGNKIPGGHKEIFRNGNNKYTLTTFIPDGIDAVEAHPVDIQFIYRESDFEDFDAASRMIQRYYAASDICDTILVHIGNIDPQDLSQSLQGYLNYYDFRRAEQVLKDEDFISALPLKELDPADHYGDMRRVGGRLYGLKMNLDNALRSWRGLVKKTSAMELADKLYVQSHFWYDLSRNVEYHYKDLFYSLGNISNDFSAVDSLAKTFHPQDGRFINDVCRYSAEKFLEEARYNIEIEDYTHAVSLGGNAKFYAEKAEALEDEINEVLGLAWQGLYESYILISRRTITIGNYEFAEQYLNEATALYNRSEGYLSDNDGVGEVFRHLFNAVLSQAQTSVEQGVPRDALYFFSEAARIDSSYLSARNSIMVKENLDKLQHAVYFSYLDEISYFINSGDGFMARDYYDKAAGYRMEHNIVEDIRLLDSLNSKIKSLEFLDFLHSAQESWPENPQKALSLLEQAAFFLNSGEIVADTMWNVAVEMIVVPQMKKKLSHGRVLVWGGKFEEARLLISEMNRQSILFGLREHPVHLLIEDINDRMLKKQCTDLENNYRKNIFAVRSTIREGNFLEASDILSSLSLDEAENCGFDISEARSSEKEYSDYFHYYLLIDTCRTHLIFSRAELAAEYYMKAKDVAAKIQIEDDDFLEIKLTSLMEMYKREALSEELVVGFLRSDPLQAVQVLQFAEENEVPVSGRIMHMVGVAMGEIDMTNGSMKDGSFYTNGRKSLKPLKNAYNVKVRSQTSFLHRALLNLYNRHD